MNKLQKVGLGVTAALVSFSALADGTDPGTTIFGAIGFTTIAAGVVATALVSMGIATAFKAWGLGKKAVNRV